MFTKAKNIETAFKMIRVLSIVMLLCCSIISIVFIGFGYSAKKLAQDRVYVIAGSKALEAFASDRRENIPVEAKDHIRTFHSNFFNLEPDDKLIKENVGKALYLADQSAKREYDNLKERNYFTNLITSNISQRIQIDTVQLSLESYPYAFQCTARIEITRTTSVVERLLITKGYLRTIARSDNNPHGFLIEQWTIVEDRDLKVRAR